MKYRTMDIIKAVGREGGKAIRDTMRGAKNLILRAMDKPLKPRLLVFEVTDACNSRCVHCDIWRKAPTEDMLTSQEIEEMLNNDLFADLEAILITGGEPVLRRDLAEIILAMHRAAPRASMLLSTNGLLPQRVANVVKFALEHDIRIGVGVSLDGIGEEHDKIRGVKGNFNKVDQLLRELVALRDNHEDKIGVSVGITLSEVTIHSFGEVRAYAERLNVNLMVQLYDEAPFYRHDTVDYNEALPPNLRQLPKDDLIKATQALPTSLHHEVLVKAVMGKTIKFPCFSLYTFCLLRCNGDIAPCLRFADMKVGNVREEYPSQIWHSPAAKEARKTVKGCKGCLNTWVVGESYKAYYLPVLLFGIKHAPSLIKRIRQYGKL
ncbi:radical SAM protein [Chloroflexota bacterium]